jgi:HEAT repeats
MMFPSVAMSVFLGTVGCEPWFPPLPAGIVNQKLVTYKDIDPANPPPREQGPGFLVDAGPRAYPVLHSYLEDEYFSVAKKASILRLLRGQPHDRSRFIDPCLKLLDDDSRGVRTESLRLLSEIGNGDHVEKVFPLLYHRDVYTRRPALDALVALGDQRHAAVLAKYLSPAPREVLVGSEFYRQVEAGVAALDKKPAPKAKPVEKK